MHADLGNFSSNDVAVEFAAGVGEFPFGGWAWCGCVVFDERFFAVSWDRHAEIEDEVVVADVVGDVAGIGELGSDGVNVNSGEHLPQCIKRVSNEKWASGVVVSDCFVSALNEASKE